MEEMMGIGDFDPKKVIDIKSESCCDILVNPEANNSTSTNADDFLLEAGSNDKTDFITSNMKYSGDQPPNAIDEVQIKQEVDDDSVKVDFSYKIIDTFNSCEVQNFKPKEEKILPYTGTSLNIGQANNKQIQLNMDNKTDCKCEMTNAVNVCHKEKIVIKK